MLARCSKLLHSSGITIETPLLVPSFSSKGFKFKSSGGSEIQEAFDISSEVLTESLLISAYDIFYKYMPGLEDVQRVPEVIFVDSGGYETSDTQDFSAVTRVSSEPRDWSEDKLRSVLDQLSPEVAGVIVNFDHPMVRVSVAEQIDRANSFFDRYPQHLHDILIKPETADQKYVQMASLLDQVPRLSPFDVIGLTEKELGSSLLKRMQNISTLRLALDESGSTAPIHIFGSLDPITSTLYFVAGAEIFDGLTWLRYSYRDGTAIYPANYGALEVGIIESDDLVRARSLTNNVYRLRDLQNRMKKYHLDGDFNQFGTHGALIEDAFNTLRTKIPLPGGAA